MKKKTTQICYLFQNQNWKKRFWCQNQKMKKQSKMVRFWEFLLSLFLIRNSLFRLKPEMEKLNHVVYSCFVSKWKTSVFGRELFVDDTERHQAMTRVAEAYPDITVLFEETVNRNLGPFQSALMHLVHLPSWAFICVCVCMCLCVSACFQGHGPAQSTVPVAIGTLNR